MITLGSETIWKISHIHVHSNHLDSKRIQAHQALSKIFDKDNNNLASHFDFLCLGYSLAQWGRQEMWEHDSQNKI